MKVVRGEPTPEELAVIVAVVAAKAAAGGTEAPARPRSVWNAPERLVRRPQRPGPGAWRASAWPV
jgi:hypothetical protein